MRDERYARIFEYSAASLWEEDISKLRSKLNDLKREKTFDLRTHLAAHPEFVQEAVGLIEVTDVNQASLRLFEADRKEQLLGPLHLGLDASSRMALVETIFAIDEGKNDVEAESTALTLKGKKLSLIVKSHIPPAASAYSHMIVSLVDITERKHLEAVLSWERLLLGTLLDNLPDRIYFKDTMSRFIVASRSQALGLGLRDRSQAIGRTDADFFSEDHARKALEDEQHIMRTEEPLLNTEERVTYPDRPYSWFITTKLPLRDQKGRIVGTFGISHDITARKRLEARNQEVATLLDSADDAIVGTDLDRRITVWNTGAERTYGYSAEETIGATLSSLIPPELEEETRIIRERVMLGEQVTNFETTRLRKDGSRITIAMTLSAIRDAAGKIVGMASTARDVTARKALEAQLSRVQRLESLATLSGGVAHQFNNINTVIKGYLDLIGSEKGLPPRFTAYVEAALEGVQRAVAITDRLLMLTEPRSAASTTVHLDVLARTIVSLQEKRMEDEDVRLVLELSSVPPVAVDESHLKFVLSSLIDNALDSLIDRPVRTLTIRTGCTRDGSYLDVEDSGCGIPEINVPRLFMPFYSAKGEWAPTGSPQARLKGVGLSLAVSNMAISEYGGRIEVQSTVGAGSTFRVILPIPGSGK